MTASVVAKKGTREVVRVKGPDAPSYLQGQLSQDVSSLAVDDSVLSLVLSPQGKVDAWVRVTRISDEEFWLDVDAGYGQKLADRLQRFLLRTDATVEATDLVTASLRATDGSDITSAAPISDDVVRVVPALGWPTSGYGLIGGEAAIEATLDSLDVEMLDADGWERLRIQSKVPAMGHELTEDTIPASAGIVEESVSFTKGCYTGQELVARIDSRGNNVPTLMGSLVATGPIAEGASVSDASGGSMATVTSVASDPTESEPHRHIALGYVKRAVDLPAEGTAGDVKVTLRRTKPES